MNDLKVFARPSESEEKRIQEYSNYIRNLIVNKKIAVEELPENLRLFLRRRDLMQILYMNELYQKIINVQGDIVEFGVRWGGNLALLANLRSIYEPYKYTRKVLGFDTFEGFPSYAAEDGNAVEKGNFSITEGFEKDIDTILSYHEQDSPIAHISKHELMKGDATVTFEKYLDSHPEAIFSLVYFDFDLYEPTKKCLSLIMEHVTKGTVIGFDELNHQQFPGETLALKEVLGLSKYSIQCSLFSPCSSFLVIE